MLVNQVVDSDQRSVADELENIVRDQRAATRHASVRESNIGTFGWQWTDQSKRRYRKSAQMALTPSLQVIFLPSS